MSSIPMTAFDLATRFIGVEETPGTASNPLVLGMLRLDQKWPVDDEVAWCSAFVNFVAWMLRLPRSKNLAARSWLTVGEAIPLSEARAGFDVVILKRGDGAQPGPEVIQAPGHVGYFAGGTNLSTPLDVGSRVQILGGNQNNHVSVAPFPSSRVLGVRRLYR